jgi:hypothetical protein
VEPLELATGSLAVVARPRRRPGKRGAAGAA